MSDETLFRWLWLFVAIYAVLVVACIVGLIVDGPGGASVTVVIQQEQPR